MKSIISSFLALLGAILFLSQDSNGQTGSKAIIKIFSEMKGVQYYLDEQFQGIDIAQIENVDSGGHYLKAVLEEVVVFGEIVNVGATGSYPVLIKNNQEVQKKILDSKYKQIQEYKNRKVEILISKSYISNTTGGSSSVTYPNYYTYNTNTKINTTTTMTEVTDWKIVVGGTREISEYNLAVMVQNQVVLKRISDYQEYIAKENAKIRKKNNTKAAVGIPLYIVSSGGCLTLFYGILFEPQWYKKLDSNHPNFVIPTTVGSIFGALFGYGLAMSDTKEKSYYRQMTLPEAALAAQQANANLKKKLGLPESFEP